MSKKNFAVLEDKRFNSMVRAMRKNTNADLKQVVRIITGEIVSKAARDTKRTNAKKIKQDIDDYVSKTFRSKSGDKIRKGKDGSLIYRSSRMTGNRWIKLRNNYSTNAISAKNPAGQPLGKKLQASANRSLAELRAAVKNLYRKKKAQIASGQASFLYMLQSLKIPLKNRRGLGMAMKVKLPSTHKRDVSAKGAQTGFSKFVIFIKSRSRSALNPTAAGRSAFFKAFYGKSKSFRVASERQIEKTAKKFAKQNGFTVK